CPNGVNAAVSGMQMVTPGTRVADVMEIKTSVPAVVYDIYPYGGALSDLPKAALLVPATPGGTHYLTPTVSSQAPSPRGRLQPGRIAKRHPHHGTALDEHHRRNGRRGRDEERARDVQRERGSSDPHFATRKRDRHPFGKRHPVEQADRRLGRALLHGAHDDAR